MDIFIVYDHATGKIIQYMHGGNISIKAARKSFSSHSVVPASIEPADVCDMANKYVCEGNLVDRPSNKASVQGRSIAGLPAPCTINIDGTPYECNEPSVELDLPMPGTYHIKIEAFPYLDKEFTIEVDA